MKGPCPLVIAREGAVVKDVAFECVTGAAAIDVKGPSVTISGTVLNAALVRAVDPKGVVVDKLSVTGSSSENVIAVFGHTSGDIDVVCSIEQTVVRQPLDGVAKYSSLCTPIDLEQLMGIFGRRYEIEFYHKNVFSQTDDTLFTTLLLVALFGALAVLTLHEDVFWRQLDIKAP